MVLAEDVENRATVGSAGLAELPQLVGKGHLHGVEGVARVLQRLGDGGVHRVERRVEKREQAPGGDAGRQIPRTTTVKVGR